MEPKIMEEKAKMKFKHHLLNKHMPLKTIVIL